MWRHASAEDMSRWNKCKYSETMEEPDRKRMPKLVYKLEADSIPYQRQSWLCVLVRLEAIDVACSHKDLIFHACECSKLLERTQFRPNFDSSY